jgi:hypothetical protein
MSHHRGPPPQDQLWAMVFLTFLFAISLLITWPQHGPLRMDDATWHGAMSALILLYIAMCLLLRD